LGVPESLAPALASKRLKFHMAKLHVVTQKEELDTSRIGNKTVVVFDVLFATTTIVAALDAGAREVLPARDPDAARAAASGSNAPPAYLAGETLGERIPGFGHFAPMALVAEGVNGKRLVYSTTNGTVALDRASSAASVYAAALLNGAAVADHIVNEGPEATVVLLCAGSVGRLNLEDFYGAGHLVAALRARREGWQLTDAALAALAIRDAMGPEECLLQTRVGHRMGAAGLGSEVRFSAQCDVLSAVPLLRGGQLIDVSSNDG
jgi:2-phosphosulfolactate phosphatase